MAKQRPRFSRWRRLPRVYRSGEFKIPDAKSEPQRLTLYIKDALLEIAEQQAAREGFETVQDYCAALLSGTIEAKHVREHVAEVEAKRGTLEGLQAIADDPEYLAEWSAQAPPAAPSSSVPISIPLSPTTSAPEVSVVQGLESGPSPLEPALEPISPAGLVVLHHAGQAPGQAAGEGEPSTGFLPCLRRGESVSMTAVAELARALQILEAEMRERVVLDRRVAFALHRLAYEGQILHTDAWPGVFDDWTVETLHAVQEAVERILSGQDIRYFPTNP